MKIEPYSSPCTKLNSKWIKDLNIKPDTLDLIKRKVGKRLKLIGTGGNFLNRTPVAHVLRSTIDKWDLMKQETSVRQRYNKTNRQPTDWEKIFTNLTSDRGIISKIYKEHKKLTTKKLHNPIINCGAELNKEFSTEESQTTEKYLKRF